MTGREKLEPCPFCGEPARFRSNRDWHRIFVNHRGWCVLSGREEEITVPATDEDKAEIAAAWNRRAALREQAPVPAAEIPQLYGDPPMPGETWKHLKSGNDYTIVTTAIDEPTEGYVVIYTRADGSGPHWSRPLDVFTARFERISAAPIPVEREPDGWIVEILRMDGSGERYAHAPTLTLHSAERAQQFADRLSPLYDPRVLPVFFGPPIPHPDMKGGET